MKCRYCKNTATHKRTIDLDLPKFYLCDDKNCFYKLFIETNPILKGLNS